MYSITNSWTKRYLTRKCHLAAFKKQTVFHWPSTVFPKLLIPFKCLYNITCVCLSAFRSRLTQAKTDIATKKLIQFAY